MDVGENTCLYLLGVCVCGGGVSSEGTVFITWISSIWSVILDLGKKTNPNLVQRKSFAHLCLVGQKGEKGAG
jgi:hypothetical protein